MTPDIIEQLAELIHQRYVQLAIEQGIVAERPLARRTWQELSEVEREPSRAQARDVPTKMLELGFECVPAGTPGSAPFRIDESRVESLARAEHERWMQQRVAAGWTYGAARDDRLLLHPLLIPYDELTDSDKEHDREPIRNLADLLDAAGLAVRPLEA